MRWSLFLQDYNHDIRHIKATANGLADTLRVRQMAIWFNCKALSVPLVFSLFTTVEPQWCGVQGETHFAEWL